MEVSENSGVREMVRKKKTKREKSKGEYDSVGLQGTHDDAKISSKTDDDSMTHRTVDDGNDGEDLSETVSNGHKDNLYEKAESKRKRKKEKRKRKENGDDDDNIGNRTADDGNDGEKLSETVCDLHEDNLYEKAESKKKRKKEKGKRKENDDDGDSMANRTVDDGNDGETVSDGHEDNLYEKAERKRKRKEEKKKRKENDEGSIESDEVAMKSPKSRKKHKKEKNYKDDSPTVQQDITMKDSEGKKKKMKSVENGSNGPTPKKVRFSSENEVFTLPSDPDTGNETETGDDNLIRGKRFTLEEDEIVRQAVFKYIEDHNLGDEGLNMLLNSKKYSPRVRGCWKEIGSAIPYRPYTASYYRAQVLFRRSEERKWTQEEYDEILKYQAAHGNQWRALADKLGKHRWHVKDTWRRIKLPNIKHGHWSQDEYQKLFDLINTDLQLKISAEKRSKHGMLRDNICWTAISDNLSTRSVSNCCIKWYDQLTSPMVAQGVWADVDDYRLISALYALDATCMEDVDWDDLLDDRDGDVCLKRWNQMVLHVGRHGSRSFAENIEVLMDRYCPHLLEAREAWDNKPRVP